MFDAFMKTRGLSQIGQFDHAVATAYIEFLQTKDNPRFSRVGLAETSIRRRLASVSSYIEYIRATSDPNLRNPLKDLVCKWTMNNKPKPADEGVLNPLVSGITNLRDRMIIVLFLATGLRVSELCSLNRDTVKFNSEIDETGTEHLTGTGQVIGKGSKVRTFFLDEYTLAMFGEYLETRNDNDPALFISERKKRIDVRTVQHMLTTWCKKLGLPHVRVHQLRHSFATRLANTHIRLLVLRDLMGHASASTTQGYFKLHDSTLAQGYFAAMEFVNIVASQPPSLPGNQQ
jgi:site-specific recombinase XerC